MEVFGIKVDEGDLDKCFAEIAKVLLFERALVLGKKFYQLREIEFYYNCDDGRKEGEDQLDPYAHFHQDEKHGAWRLHGAGIDIVLRDEEKGRHGGILLRGMSTQDGTLIDGPWRLACQVFRGFGLATGLGSLQLVEKAWDDEGMIRGPRVGLRLREKQDPEGRKLFAPWRFLPLPASSRKDICLLALSMLRKEKQDEKTVVKTLRISENALDRYSKWFDEGPLEIDGYITDRITVENKCRNFGRYCRLPSS